MYRTPGHMVCVSDFILGHMYAHTSARYARQIFGIYMEKYAKFGGHICFCHIVGDNVKLKLHSVLFRHIYAKISGL